jgi:hypothetical protein
MSTNAHDCLADVLDSFCNGQIETVEDLQTILMAWDFVDEDGELTRYGQALFTDRDDGDDDGEGE